MLSLLSASDSSTGPACFDRNRLVVVVECSGGIDIAPSCHSCTIMRCRVRGGVGKGRIGWNGTADARLIDCSIHGPTLVIVTRQSTTLPFSATVGERHHRPGAVDLLCLVPLLQLFFLLSLQFESSTFGAGACQYKGCHAPSRERQGQGGTLRNRAAIVLVFFGGGGGRSDLCCSSCGPFRRRRGLWELVDCSSRLRWSNFHLHRVMTMTSTRSHYSDPTHHVPEAVAVVVVKCVWPKLNRW